MKRKPSTPIDIPGAKYTGHWVRLKQSEHPAYARIEDECPLVARGAVYLDRPLDGFRWWNKADLVRVAAPSTETT